MTEDRNVLPSQITRLHDQNEVARRIIDSFIHSVSGEGPDHGALTTATTTDQALEVSGLQGHQRVKITEIFKKLEEIGCGRFVPGRRTHPSRFVWEVKPLAVAQALKEGQETTMEPTELPSTEAQTAEQAASRIITYKFPMRGDFLEVRLPFNLKRNEAERLAQFIESLAAED